MLRQERAINSWRNVVQAWSTCSAIRDWQLNTTKRTSKRDGDIIRSEIICCSTHPCVSPVLKILQHCLSPSRHSRRSFRHAARDAFPGDCWFWNSLRSTCNVVWRVVFLLHYLRNPRSNYRHKINALKVLHHHVTKINHRFLHVTITRQSPLLISIFF